MTDYPVRRHPRLKCYDYGRNGTYFVTICALEGRSLFATVGRDDLGAPHVHLSDYGAIVENYILSIPRAYFTVGLEKYVVMPNHVHLLLDFHAPGDGAPGSSRPTQLLPRVVAALKRFSNRDAGRPLWQDGYHEHIIRDENDFLTHWAYIDANPARWAEDEYYFE